MRKIKGSPNGETLIQKSQGWVQKNYPNIDSITDAIGLAPIQKIAITEKYRPIYEKQAKENQSNAGGDRKSDEYKKSVPPILGEAIRSNSNNETNTKLSKLAGVGKETYRMGAKILNSDNEKLKQEVLSGEKSINAGYKELTGKRISIYNRSQIWERCITESTYRFPKWKRSTVHRMTTIVFL